MHNIGSRIRLTQQVILACLLLGWSGVYADTDKCNKQLRIGVSLFRPWTMCVEKQGNRADKYPLKMCDKQNSCIRQESCELAGFEIDIAKRLAEDRGECPVFVEFEWKNAIKDLDSEKFDVIVAGMAVTAKRALEVWFSNPYATSGIGLAANIDSTKKMRSLNELKKKGYIKKTIQLEI